MAHPIPIKGEDENNEPGSTIMWFGMHKETRIDQLEYGYAKALLRLEREKHWPNLVKFKDLYTKYLSRLDETQNPLLTTKVWFGMYQGDNFISTYFDKRRWFWLLDNCPQLKSELLEVEQRYLRWQARNPPISGLIPRALAHQWPPLPVQFNNHNGPKLEDPFQMQHQGEEHGAIRGNPEFYNQRDLPIPSPEGSDENPQSRESSPFEKPSASNATPAFSHHARSNSPMSQADPGQMRNVKNEKETKMPKQQESPTPEPQISIAGPSTPIRKRKKPSKAPSYLIDSSDDELESKSFQVYKISDSDEDTAPIQLLTPSQSGPRKDRTRARRPQVQRKSTPIVIDDSDGPYPTPSHTGRRAVKREFKAEPIVIDDSDEESLFVPKRARNSTPIWLKDENTGEESKAPATPGPVKYE